MTTSRPILLAVIYLFWVAARLGWAFHASSISRTDSISNKIVASSRTVPSSRHSHHLRAVAKKSDFLGRREDSSLNRDGSYQVGIVGAGAVALATAALLSKHGHDVMLWSPSGKGTRDLLAAASSSATATEKREESEQNVLIASGAMDHQCAPRIASSSQQLVRENDVILVCLPANGHKQVFDELAPHLSGASSAHKHVIISSHASLGALYLAQAIEKCQQQSFDKDHRIRNGHDISDVVSITAWGTTVCTARRPSGTSVDVKSIRKSVDLCTIPEQESSNALALCQSLFPHTNFQPRDGLLAISLSNLNPQNHLGMALGNISRMDKGEAWYQFQMTTPTIGRFLQDLDQERLSIAKALGVEVKTIYEHFSLSFHVPISDSISDMCQEIYKSGHDVHGPNTPASRYITEDVPFGLVLTATLGRMVDRPAVLHESGIMICNSMYGCDFVAKNDLLQALRLDEMSLEDLQQAVRTGRTNSVKAEFVSSAVK